MSRLNKSDISENRVEIMKGLATNIFMRNSAIRDGQTDLAEALDIITQVIVDYVKIKIDIDVNVIELESSVSEADEVIDEIFEENDIPFS